ncbi:MAG TPA: hypothetical protein VN625_03370, partial [Desulfuromonadaceae bacterium]|nr:hypothetical protein [Desulfuromonadaceae bacterium]
MKFWIIILQLVGLAAVGFAAEKPGAVAVLDFAVPDAESNRWAWARGGLADLLQNGLQQQGLVLLDRDTIRAVLSEQRLAAQGITPSGYLALGKLLNAQYLIAGKLTPLPGDRFQIEIEIFSVEAVETRGAAKATGIFPNDLSSAVKAVAQQIATNIPAGGAEESQPIRRAPKPESLIMFYRGLNACAGGRPEQGAAYFMNAAGLDRDFTVPLLWEIKAYEMAGMTNHANIRRQELADILNPLGLGITNETPDQPVIAVLNPVIDVPGAFDSTALAVELKRALLAENRVRVFAYEGIGDAVAEQDLRLSSFFAGQNAPRYGRWLMADSLLLCRVNRATDGQVFVELSLVDPMNATLATRVRRSLSPDARQIPEAVKQVISNWLGGFRAELPVNPEMATATSASPTPDLRPVYQDLVKAMLRLHEEPGKIESHRAMAKAFAATGRPRLAQYEEQCAQRLDVPQVDKDELVLSNSPASLAAGCIRYNRAVDAWQGKNWPEAITQARQTRQILRALIDLHLQEVKDLPPAAQHVPGSAAEGTADDFEREMTAATYFLEGASLRESGKREDAIAVMREGLNFMQSLEFRDFCLPLGPYIGNFFGKERVYGFGGEPPGIRTRLEQQLAALEHPGQPIEPVPQKKPEAVPPPVDTNSTAYALQQAETEFNDHHFARTLQWYQKALNGGVTMSECPKLNQALLEMALDQNLDHLQDQISSLGRQFNLPPVQPSWVDWFAVAGKYHTSRAFDFEKAAVCYRHALDFLEHPDEMGIYRLEKEPRSDRVWLRGPAATDLGWFDLRDSRWFTSAFYLAQ